MTFPRRALVVIFASALATAHADLPGWKSFEPPQRGLRVAFPGAPSHRGVKRLNIGGHECSLYFYTLSQKGGGFSLVFVGHSPEIASRMPSVFPNGNDPKMRAALRSCSKGVVTQRNFKVVGEEAGHYGAYPFLDTLMVSLDGKTSSRVRCVLTHRRAVYLVTVLPKGEPSSRATRAFLASLRIQEGR